MKICSPQLGVSPDSNLGGEVHDREMLRALADLGEEIFIVLPLGKKHDSHKNWHFYYLPTPIVYPPWIFNILVLPYLFWIYFRRGFDVLRVHSPSFVGPAALLFKYLFPRVKVVATYHHLEKPLNQLDKFLARGLDLVITVSEETKKELDLPGVVIIPNGVDSKFRPLPKDKKLVARYGLGGKKVLLFLGQLIPRKNIPFLFRVIERLPQDYVLLICGDGPLRGELREAAPDRVIFTGLVPEERKVDYYNLADIFVYPSIREGFGLSIVEALGCGQTVIANNLSAYRQIGSDKNLILLDLNVDIWAEKIRSLLLTVKLASRKRYSWQMAGKKYLKVLHYCR